MAENAGPECFRFEGFLLDAGDRRLHRGGAPVDLNSRYFDALALLIGERGKLVSKERFHEEVWRGVPVTDEALTQCIRTLRRQLGDDAANPRFIETVPKHGYRFIAQVEPDSAEAPPLPLSPKPAREWLRLGGAGTAGGAGAGAIGGLIYGFAGAAQPLAPGMAAVSVVLVIALATVAMATLGAAGVAFGIAASSFASGRTLLWHVAGGALGGMIVGAVVKLLGIDALNLLFGRSPGDITGATEGAALGGAIGLGAWLARRATTVEQGMAWGGITGGAAGALIALLGGRMMAGSLDLLAHSFPGSRVRLDAVWRLFGETDLGPVSRVVTGGFEGLLFGACIVGAMVLCRRAFRR
jgi:DNA-binding winged helix-turn-helix (wHTH) protein